MEQYKARKLIRFHVKEEAKKFKLDPMQGRLRLALKMKIRRTITQIAGSYNQVGEKVSMMYVCMCV